MTAALTDPGPPDVRVGLSRRLTATVVALAGVAVACLVSLMIGNQALSPGTVLRALWSDESSGARDIVRGLRMDRTIIGVAVGLALGAAGALMQALARNPLADPGLLGVNAGAAAAIVTGIAVLHVESPHVQIWFAFAGAAAASLAVYVLGSGGRSSTTPLRLALAGAALSAVLAAYVNGIALSSQPAFDKMRFWLVGSLVGQDLSVLVDALPFLALGLVAALVITPPSTRWRSARTPAARSASTSGGCGWSPPPRSPCSAGRPPPSPGRSCSSGSSSPTSHGSSWGRTSGGSYRCRCSTPRSCCSSPTPSVASSPATRWRPGS